jgi:hypothetical protein
MIQTAGGLWHVQVKAAIGTAAAAILGLTFADCTCLLERWILDRYHLDGKRVQSLGVLLYECGALRSAARCSIAAPPFE